MPVEVLEHQPGVSRRSFLRAAVPGVAAVSVMTPWEVAELLAQEARVKEKKVDVSKLTANELLDVLPREIQIESEFKGVATMEKRYAKNPKNLVIILRHVHEGKDDTPEHPYLKKIVAASGKEVGHLIGILHEKYHVRCVGAEGFEEHEYRDRVVILKRLPQTEEELQTLWKRARATGSMEDLRKARIGQAAYDRFIESLRETAPFEGLLEMEHAGKVVLIPTESTEALKALKAEKRKPSEERNDNIILYDREIASLPLLDRYLTLMEENVVTVPFGATHDWKKSGEVHNRTQSNNQCSFAILTSPAAHEYDNLVQLIEELKRKQRQNK